MATLRDIYLYCTACRAKLSDHGSAKVCPNCGKQYYFNPLPNVTILITNQRAEILFIERAAEPFKGWWDLPGGFVENGESLEEAAHREAEEEVGAKLEQLRYTASVPTTYELKGITYSLILVFFEARLAEGAGLMGTNEAMQYKFFGKKAIPLHKVAFEAQRHFLESYQA